MVQLPFRPAACLAILAIGAAAAFAQGSAEGISAEKLFAAIDIHEGSTVCEVGAGDGQMSIKAARLVGSQGRVYTNELGDSKAGKLREKITAAGLAHVTVVTGEAARTNFPDAICDALFLRDVYHHFSEPAAMNRSIAAALKPGGRVAVVDFRPPGKEAEQPADRGKDGMHGVTADTVSRELKEAGFEPVSAPASGNRWFMVVVAKPRS
jgi:ubiquinone/menaquinone biosynthesis C-methylase UbiE